MVDADYAAMEEAGISAAALEDAIRRDDASEIASLVNNYDFPVDCFLDGQGHPLTLACELGHLTAAKELVAWGADIHDVREGEQPSPLIAAAANGHSHIVSWLLQNGVDPNYYYEILDPRGDFEAAGTALSESLRNGHDDIAWMLIESGADTNVVIFYCTDVEFSPPVQTEPIIFFSIKEKKHAILRRCANNKETLFRILSEDGEDYSPLCYAIKNNDIDSINILLQSGSSVLEQGGDFLPIECAAQNGNFHIAKILIANGVDLISKNTDGEYLFDYLSESFPNNSDYILEQLRIRLRDFFGHVDAINTENNALFDT